MIRNGDAFKSDNDYGDDVDYGDDDYDYGVDYNYGDDDLYIIGAVCVSVCHKSHYFRIQGIWSFHLFPDTFRTQRIWSFPCLLTLLYSSDLIVSHVYSYIPYSKNLVVSMFLDTFRIQRIWSFPCL